MWCKGYSDEVVKICAECCESAGERHVGARCRRLPGCAKLRCDLSKLRSTQGAARMSGTCTDDLPDVLRYQAARRNSMSEHVRVSRGGARAPGGRRKTTAGRGRSAPGAHDSPSHRAPIRTVLPFSIRH